MGASTKSMREHNTSLTGKIGRVTGRIAPGEIGEILLDIRGGTCAYHAYPFDRTSTFLTGTKVLVIEFKPPQSVYVDTLPDVLQAVEL